LEVAVSDETKNVFISHIHEDDEVLQGLKDLLGRNGYTIRDGSIDSSKPNDAQNEAHIKSNILAPRIRWASTMIVLISPDTHTSKWVEWEIDCAAKEGKRIIGVWGHGCQDSNIPANLDRYADAVVGWQAERVMDAITGRIDNWFTCDGSQRAPRTIVRYSC
jgi:hypothetical protein